MKIDLKWEKPLRMKKSSKNALEYQIRGIERLPRKPCVYVFARRFGNTVEPLYIGQALKLRGRIRDHLNSLGLIRHIDTGPIGHRILLVGRLKLHPGQQADRVLNIVEKALIKRALAQGFDIFNKQGTKTPVHEIRSKGNRASLQLAPRKMQIERK